ncbi:hypothetical protein B0H14DRAFT_2928438 [Mycena olivaceomarginata]|nr:hypothetical protein B0H14DRAFT_2928438 [Mycena olivaceomarginata]
MVVTIVERSWDELSHRSFPSRPRSLLCRRRNMVNAHKGGKEGAMSEDEPTKAELEGRALKLSTRRARVNPLGGLLPWSSTRCWVALHRVISRPLGARACRPSPTWHPQYLQRVALQCIPSTPQRCAAFPSLLYRPALPRPAYILPGTRAASRQTSHAVGSTKCICSLRLPSSSFLAAS